jgi:hypothetical protein
MILFAVKRACFVLALFFLLPTVARAQADPLSWVNAIRRAAGTAGVAADELLSATARKWAARLAQTGVLSHRGNDGFSALDRYRALGGTETRVGEILGAGPNLTEIEKAWKASDEHRAVALAPDWTHIGWGRGKAKGKEVWVVLFCEKLVDELIIIDEEKNALSVSGRFIGQGATRPLLYSGLAPLEPVSWDAGTRRFSFRVMAPLLAGYIRLGYLSAGNEFRLTNAFTLPRGTGCPAGSDRSAEPVPVP